ncbi:MAG TPA: hypothetical protein PKG95_07220 [Anaerolineaceae bacterium]|nr:hypothetical protein [Anaerolineaceae bacterium]
MTTPLSPATTLALFDLDGVLIQPGGYQQAVFDTVRFFCHQMGLPDLAPDQNLLAIFESQGITSEWDQIALCLAAVLDDLAAASGQPEADTLEAAISWAQTISWPGGRVDYRRRFARLQSWVVPGTSPAEAVLAACQRGEAAEVFPALHQHPLLLDLLGSVRNFSKFWPQRVFQAYVLGSRIYAQVYGQASPLNCRAYLGTYDRSLLLKSFQAKIIAAQSAGQLQGAIYTARPSLLPADLAAVLPGYAPEAEMAQVLAGLEGLPLVGYGGLRHLSERLGLHPDRLVKPSAAQALAAVGAALGAPVWQALRWAYAFLARTEPDLPPLPGDPPAEIRLPDALTIHVFEDSPIGILAARRAVEILADVGYTVRLRAWGIATHPAKIQALTAVGAAVHPDINAALGRVL